MTADDDDDDDDDDYIDDDALGDWRTFRSSLVGNGLTGEKETEQGPGTKSNEGKDKENEKSPNVEVLFSQSDKLGEEYLSGAWAHEIPDIEVGGLVARLPLEAEIHRSKKKSLLGKELLERMQIEDEGSSGSSYLSLGDDEKGLSSPDVSFSLVGAQTLLWYKKAGKLIEEEMTKIADCANENGEIDPQTLGEKSKSLLNLYLDHQNSWQEVCLVTDRDASKSTSTTFVLNRPMTFSANKDVAKIILFGAKGSVRDKVAVSQTQDLVKFLTAFEQNCAVYIGGPDKIEEPAVMVHGYADLEGAEEISPGTRIYRGGVKAAVDGVVSGKYSPFDFRFFVGRYEYENGDLDVAVHLNKYQSLACARPIILKQCIQLPKPLWHEVLELCGGELKELSKLELMKRDDIVD